MPGIALVRHTATPLPARGHARPEAPPVKPEHVEEVWDAELVGELPPPGWLAVPALGAVKLGIIPRGLGLSLLLPLAVVTCATWVGGFGPSSTSFAARHACVRRAY